MAFDRSGNPITTDALPKTKDQSHEGALAQVLTGARSAGMKEVNEARMQAAPIPSAHEMPINNSGKGVFTNEVAAKQVAPAMQIEGDINRSDVAAGALMSRNPARDNAQEIATQRIEQAASGERPLNHQANAHAETAEQPSARRSAA